MYFLYLVTLYNTAHTVYSNCELRGPSIQREHLLVFSYHFALSQSSFLFVIIFARVTFFLISKSEYKSKNKANYPFWLRLLVFRGLRRRRLIDFTVARIGFLHVLTSRFKRYCFGFLRGAVVRLRVGRSEAGTKSLATKYREPKQFGLPVSFSNILPKELAFLLLL